MVPIYQVGEANGVPNIAMKLLKGQCLGAGLDRGPVQTTVEVGRSGREIAEGLQGAHARRLVHRVLKPDNV